MKIYISGKISGLHLQEATMLFDKGERDAIAFFKQFVNCVCSYDKFAESCSCVLPINPMKKTSELNCKTYNDYMREDIRLLMDCAGIWMIKNWKDSKGATIEHNLARDLHLAIGYEND